MTLCAVHQPRLIKMRRQGESPGEGEIPVVPAGWAGQVLCRGCHRWSVFADSSGDGEHIPGAYSVRPCMRGSHTRPWWNLVTVVGGTKTWHPCWPRGKGRLWEAGRGAPGAPRLHRRITEELQHLPMPGLHPRDSAQPAFSHRSSQVVLRTERLRSSHPEEVQHHPQHGPLATIIMRCFERTGSYKRKPKKSPSAQHAAEDDKRCWSRWSPPVSSLSPAPGEPLCWILSFSFPCISLQSLPKAAFHHLCGAGHFARSDPRSLGCDSECVWGRWACASGETTSESLGERKFAIWKRKLGDSDTHGHSPEGPPQLRFRCISSL